MLKNFNWYLTFCLLIAVFGSSFQYGYNIGLYNTPYAVGFIIISFNIDFILTNYSIGNKSFF